MPKTSSTPVFLPQIKPSDLHRFHARLTVWYKAHGRHHLPWRTTDDAYHIWVSEVMLQQTQVATVLDRFYHPFLKAFPTIKHLAAAPREKVMKAWEGLGYYRRAGYLHEAAKMAVEGGLAPYAALTPAASGSRLNGATQDYLTALMDLPGIGRNTATAILAFAHHRPVAILEANVKRIVARIFALAAPTDAQLWEGAETLLDAQHPFDYNQSMMDLGSLICTPKAPDCPACPANGICKGQANAEAYPAPKAKKAKPVRRVTIAVTEDARGKLYLEKRNDALLGGLYGFPQAPGAAGTPVGEIIHIYTHFRLEGRVMYQKLDKAGRGPNWHTREEIRGLPLSGVDHKTLALVDAGHSGSQKAKKPSRRTAAY
jgi:A/G-specific adenine glycosylase